MTYAFAFTLGRCKLRDVVGMSSVLASSYRRIVVNS